MPAEIKRMHNYEATWLPPQTHPPRIRFDPSLGEARPLIGRGNSIRPTNRQKILKLHSSRLRLPGAKIVTLEGQVTCGVHTE